MLAAFHVGGVVVKTASPAVEYAISSSKRSSYMLFSLYHSGEYQSCVLYPKFLRAKCSDFRFFWIWEYLYRHNKMS